MPLPKHVAIIMDGNGRWAKKRMLPRVMGHRAAIGQVREILRYLGKEKVAALTLYAFSTENWKRPKEEVNFLLDLMLKSLLNEMNALCEANVRLRILGDLSLLPQDLRTMCAEAEERMANNSGIFFNLAINYGGRSEILHAVKQLLTEINQRKIQPQEIDEAKFTEFLYTNGLPDPDLVIRTGGEKRLSNFLLWQSAYAELYFTDILFPDFDLKALKESLAWYSTRERRYGMISEQVST